ncbi:MAG TPA: lyase [Ramlibacter sp.]|nr:lyase [Ramlibacter sp.]
MNITRRTLVVASAASIALPALAQQAKTQSWPLNTPRRAGIHDVAPAPDGGIWFTAQASGHLGHFDPKTGTTELVALGRGSSPHGVIQGPDHAAWITDGGQNAIVRVAWPSREVKVMPLPAGTPYANLNTCAFDGSGDLWFTGQSGYFGKVDVKTGAVSVKDAPRGRGAYGICSTPSGDVWFCSLANSYIARIDRATGEAHVVDPPTKNQGARRIWSDKQGRLWVSEWLSGQLSMHDPKSGQWRQWKLPGKEPMTYAVYVDDRDTVWVSDFGGDAILSFDPKTEKFERFAFPRSGINVRQILGRPGEVWLPESGTEHISLVRTA